MRTIIIFKDTVLLFLKKYGVKVLNGQLEPRHPQTHNTLKRRLQAWIKNSGGTKLDNGFKELIDYAITHHHSTLEFLSTTGRTRFVDMI